MSISEMLRTPTHARWALVVQLDISTHGILDQAPQFTLYCFISVDCSLVTRLKKAVDATNVLSSHILVYKLCNSSY